MKHNKITVKFISILSMLSIVITCLSSCSNSTANNATNTGNHVNVGDLSVTMRSASEIFTDRDSDPSYDESTAIKIALSGNSATSDSDSVEIRGSTVTIKKEGTYILSGKLDDGTVVVTADKTAKVQLVLNNAEITSKDCAAILITSADKVFVTTAKGTNNSLTNGGTYTELNDITNIDGVIFSKEDLTFNGEGTLNITANAGHGFVSKDDLKITGGTYNITSAEHGISGKDSVSIKEGNINITAGNKGIKSKNSDETGKGQITIFGSTINISKSEEGIEGTDIQILGGEINIVSSDDGINAASALNEDIILTIGGGKIKINAEGDGIDSNGNLIVSGGEIYVSGASNGGNSALDYENDAAISGGTFIACGMSQMAQNFGESSTQGSILVNLTSTHSNESVKLTDSKGNRIVEYTPEKSFNSVVVSSPEITKGNSYKIVCGDESQEITMDTLIYGSGMNMMGHPGGMDSGMKDGNGRGDRDFRDIPQGGMDKNGDMQPPSDKGIRGPRDRADSSR